MQEITGNIWDFHAQGSWITIPPNGSIRKDGQAIMGRGIAKEAATRYIDLPYRLADHIKMEGNTVEVFPDIKIITFPVKWEWYEIASVELIILSCWALVSKVERLNIPTPIYMVRPGCGNGKLAWEDVKPVISKYLDDRFVVVEISRVVRERPEMEVEYARKIARPQAYRED